MIRKITISGVITAMVLLGSAVQANDAPPDAAALVPEDAILVLEVPNPRPLVERAFDRQVVSFVQSLPPYRQAVNQPDTRQALEVIRFFENKYDVDTPELFAKLLGGGITLAVLPADQALLIVEAEDPEMLAGVHDFFRTIAEGEAAKAGEPNRVKSAEYGDVKGWSFAPEEAHAIVENQLIVANSPEILQAALDRRAGVATGSVAESDHFAAARRSIDDNADATLFANMTVLKHLPDFQDALNQNQNPLGRLLFEPLLGGLNQATWLAAGVTVDQEEAILRVCTDRTTGQDPASNRFAEPDSAADGAMPTLRVPRQIAGISLYRDLHRFYAAKDELFGQRTSGLIFFENMMGIFFSGKDLTEDVLAETHPDIRLVVARQKYDEKTGTPAVQLPGFAAIIRLRDAQDFELVAKEAWQKAIGLVNFTRGQQALPGLIIDSATQQGVSYNVAYFSVAEQEDRRAAGMRFNFQPAVAVADDHLILSSTDDLARDLIAALKTESKRQTGPVAGTHSLAVLKGPALAAILKANRDALERQNMVEKGHSREAAKKEIGGLIAALDHLTGIQVEAAEKKDVMQVNISVSYELP